MHTRIVRRGLVLVVAVVALVATTGSPAGAASYSYFAEMTSGSVYLGALTVTTTSIPACPGGLAIGGTVDDTAGTINGTMSAMLPFTASSVDYALHINPRYGSGPYSTATRDFTLHFGTVPWAITAYDVSTCNWSSTILCSGFNTIAMSIDATMSTAPPYTTGDTFTTGSSSNSGATLAACTGTLAALVGWTPPFLVSYGAGFTM